LAALPAEERARHALLFDGAFRGVHGTPPFGWQLNDNESGRAVPSQSAADGRYLDLSYFGGANMLFAEQVVTLAPGRYRLRTRAKSGSGVTSGTIFWNMSCVPGGPRLLRLALNPVRQTYGVLEAAFQVPAGCAAQRLQLAGEPGDVAATVDVQVAGVEIARAD
jgi:hypothetical protein